MSKGRTKSFKRTIMDLSDLPPEEQMKASINAVKSVALKTPVATTLTVQDSTESRGVEPGGDQPEQTSEPPETPVEPTSQVTQSTESESTDETPTEQSIPLSQVQELVTQTLTNALQPFQQQLTESQTRNQELETQLNTANTQLEVARQSTQAVENLSQLLGRSATPQQGMEFPNVNHNTSPNGDRYTGLLGEYMQERNLSRVEFTRTKKGNLQIPAYDTRRVDRFVIENNLWNPSSSNYFRLMEDLTDLGKKNGLFKGSKRFTEAETRSATTAGNIPGGFLEVLSSMMRVSSRPGLVFWQFAKTVHNFEKGYSDLVDIPRARYPNTATNSNQRLLSGAGTYTRISDNNATVQTGIAQLRLQEYGLGRPEAPPIGIPNFVSAYSMIELMELLQRDIFFDYHNWEDLIIREQWQPTTQVFYNNGNNLVSAAGDVSTGGTLTHQFLRKLYVWFHNQRIVPLPDGCYGLVTNATAVAQLKDSLETKWEAPSPEQLEALTNMMLLGYPNGENLKINGYVGKCEHFHIWETNSFASGNVGTEGVFSETDGTAGTSIFREGYAFGDATTGRGIGGAGAQIVYDENRDFGRLERAIWLSYEGHAPLDVDPTGYNDTQEVPQELRVARVRFADEAVA
ncbi:hypothetical protein Lepto7375DRAFT_7290 [Leptolyngbya sp. PCC 7375]|nr:hypothetical protein Lepto7375DRAFT_7290 [Leptolyngbya sp. PCC 7375]